MLTEREGTILRSIVRQYIAEATPVPSLRILKDTELQISPATVRNEVVRLEAAGYLIRPHHAAGSVPSDAAYRHYVETLTDVELPVDERRLISHLFYQAERKLSDWLSLASSVTAQMVHTLAVVTAPKPVTCRFKHLELISIGDSLVLLVLVLYGAKVRQELLHFSRSVIQLKLTGLANRLNETCNGLNRSEIASRVDFTEAEKPVAERVLRLMATEDGAETEESYVDGLHYLLGEPEFSRQYRLLTLIELAEQRSLLRSIIPRELASQGVQVVIGKENQTQAIQDYSVVISRYGVPEKALGTIGLVGLTRMPYVRAISVVDYIASVLSTLVADLYGGD
ncbi:MAG: heat-inducible transcriptional repressor HrcA [Chloroflexota bacterium]